LRNELFHLGISQLSAGSRTNPGGYKQAFADSISDGQFSLNDTRTSGEVISDLIKQGFIPSFCTACYRLGRVGEDFMDLAKPGLIKLNCHPNGLLTLKEYLIDYADEDTRLEGEKLINNELKDIPSETRRQKTIEYLQRIEAGERDLYF
jgi:2-iminoacetate synthase